MCRQLVYPPPQRVCQTGIQPYPLQRLSPAVKQSKMEVHIALMHRTERRGSSCTTDELIIIRSGDFTNDSRKIKESIDFPKAGLRLYRVTMQRYGNAQLVFKNIMVNTFRFDS